MERKNQTAVIIGRFQVPYLHLGHIYLISHALQQADKVLILLGTIDPMETPDERNPYTIFQRSTMIKRIFPQVEILPLFDRLGNNIAWSKQVDTLLEGEENPVLLHSRDSFKEHYHGIYPTFEVPELPGYSGTELRKSLL